MAFYLPPGQFDGKGEYVLDECPGCGKPGKFYFNLDGEVGHCMGGLVPCPWNTHGVFGMDMLRKVCEEAGTALKLVSKTAGSGKAGRRNSKGLENKDLRATFAWDVPVARNFLIDRRIGEVTAKTIPIWWNSEKEALVVDVTPVSPEYPEDVLYRMITMPTHKWMPMSGSPKTMYVWGGKFWDRKAEDMFLEGRKPFMILTEGIFDIISTGMIGHAIALLGSEISPAAARWVDVKTRIGYPVYLWADPDAAGIKAQEKIVEMLLSKGVQCDIITSNLDPKNCSKEEVKEFLKDLESR